MHEGIRAHTTVLSDLNKRIKHNNEGVDKDVIDGWKQRVLQLGKELDTLNGEVAAVKQTFHSEEFKGFIAAFNDDNKPSVTSNNSSSVPSTNVNITGNKRNVKEIIDFVNEKITANTVKVKSNDSTSIHARLNSIYAKSNDDIEVCDEEPKESDFKCPYTQTLMVKAMKK